MTKMGYWSIVANMPDERIGWHIDRQMGTKQWSGDSNHPSWIQVQQNAGDDWWLATFHWFFPHRACAISINLGRGHGGLWSGVDCGGITSQCGVVGTSVFAVAHMAVAVDWLSLWTADRDPVGRAWLLQLCLGQGSHGMGSVIWGDLTSI